MRHGWAPRQASGIPVVTWRGGRRADGVLTAHGPDHSLSSGFWGSNIFTWVKGNKPLRPFTSPSHWPLMFILVTFTMSPTYKKNKQHVIHHLAWQRNAIGFLKSPVKALTFPQTLIYKIQRKPGEKITFLPTRNQIQGTKYFCIKAAQTGLHSLKLMKIPLLSKIITEAL